MSCGRSSDSLLDLSLLSSHPRLAGNDTSVEGATSDSRALRRSLVQTGTLRIQQLTAPDRPGFSPSSLFTRPPESRQKQLGCCCDGVVDESPQRR